MHAPARSAAGLVVAVLVLASAGAGVAVRAAAQRGPSASSPTLRRQANGLLTGRIHTLGRHVLLSGSLRRRGAARRTDEPPDVLSRTSVVTDDGSEPGPSDLPETTGVTVPPLTIFKGPENALSVGGTVFPGTRGPAAPEFVDDNAVEPSIAGDREVSFVVGNFFAALTSDNGSSYQDGMVSPYDFDDDPDEGPGDYFTGDQSVVSVPRAGKPPLVAWLLMYGDAEDAKDPEGANSLRLVVFRGRKQLLSYRGTDPSISSCTYVWTPATFGLPADRAFDFPNIASTGQYLYLTAQLFNGKGTKGEGSLIWRVATSELEDDCDAGVGAFWLDEKHQPATLVQGASSTMFAAAHTNNLVQGDRLEIYKVADSSATMETEIVNVTDYRGDGDYDCPLDAGGKDPCGNTDLEKVGAVLGDGKMAGFRSGSTVGWLWNAKQQGKDYPYPYIRVATFDTGSLALQDEASIYNNSTAITYPAVGVGDDGSVAVTAYLMGGATLPTAVGWVVTDPRNGWPPGQMTTLRTSTSAPGKSGFGDYFAVRQYDNCPNTFVGTTMTYSGGAKTPDVGTVWFGADRRAGCPDLAVEGFDEAQAGEPPGLLVRGAEATATITTVNTGGGSADPSRSAVYLSKDTLIDEAVRPSQSAHLVPELAAGATDVGTTTFTVPRFMAPGEYYIIVCADDRTRVKEVSERDNCRAGTQPATVLFTQTPLDSEIRDLDWEDVRSALVPGASFTVSSRVVGHHLTAAQLAGTRAVYTLSPSPEASPVEVPLRAVRRRQTLAGAAATRARRVHDTLRLPARLAPGEWYVRACLRRPRNVGDARIANDCRSLRRPIVVRRRSP